VNPIINPDEAKNRYNTGEPATDVEMYLPLWTNILQSSGAYTADEATAAARTPLPDILRYDRTQPAAYPNGRALTNDVFSARMALLTNSVRSPPTGSHRTTTSLPSSRSSGPPNP